ncbi:MAG TPA: UDP-N-acetylglucosamine 2-epimerase (non-hydrolyzing) [Methylocystis sp.]|nr:UDP-N-acetylglucosamine 2-epimerase (non-hydrolyzing) [Methylocystis sp.]
MRDGRPLEILCVAGARPNFVKLAPLIAAFDATPNVVARILHTAQHSDARMSRVFFDELEIRDPDVLLDPGAGGHAEQTARVMLGVGAALDERRPDLLLVVGDVASTLAAALAAKQKGVPVAHVEAGLRSFDETMPEEINRLLTDRLSDVLYTTEAQAEANLKREGIDSGRIVFAGNVMIDSLLRCLPRATPFEKSLASLEAPDAFIARARSGYVLATLHRPSNVDQETTLAPLLGALVEISRRAPIVFPVHPRTQRMLARPSLRDVIRSGDILLGPPIGYLAMIGLMRDARLALTDSGGVQEETTGLRTPCLTLRTSTERPATIDCGSNRLIGVEPESIVAAACEILRWGGARVERTPPLWDGKAAERIVADIVSRFG